MLVSELIDRTLAEWLYPGGDENPLFDILLSGIDNSPSTLTVPLEGRAENVPRDSVLQIDSELILTKETSGSTVTAAKRAYNGSTIASHSTGAIVQVDPTFTRIEILHALRAIVGKLYAWGLYQRAVDTAMTFTVRNVIEAPAGTKEIHSILVRRSTSDELYVPLKQRGTDWIEHKEFDPIKFWIRRSVAAEGQPMRVVCIKDFTLPATETDNLTSACGLSEQIQEDLPMAVAGQVLKGREIPRVTLDRIREALSAAGLNPGVTMNIGDAMIRSFQKDAVMAERQRLNETDEPSFEWQRR